MTNNQRKKDMTCMYNHVYMDHFPANTPELAKASAILSQKCLDVSSGASPPSQQAASEVSQSKASMPLPHEGKNARELSLGRGQKKGLSGWST